MREAVRLDPKAFTRDRILSFPVLINFLLSGLTAGVQQELDAYFPRLNNQADFERTVSAQAFSEARMKLSADVFKKINDFLLSQLAEHVTVPLWHGLRLVAADGSKLAVALRDGTARNATNAMAFALYLPGTEMTLAYELYHADACERQMLFEHLDLLSSRDLLILDRGYPATWLIAALLQRGIQFCMRVDQSGYAVVKAFVRSGEAERIVTLKPTSYANATTYEIERTELIVRLVRCVTPDGKIRVLMTSLLDVAAYPAADFSALYHRRWRIEECFKRIKHRLGLEAVSGCSWLTAQQDLGAKIVCDNLNAVCVLAALPEQSHDLIDMPSSHRKINRTAAFPALKQCLPRCLLGLAEDITETLDHALKHIAKSLQYFTQGAAKPRPKTTKPHGKQTYKR